MSNGFVERTLKLSNLTVRVITGLVGLVLVLIAAYVGGWLLTALIIPVVVIGTLEFCSLRRGGQIPLSAVAIVPMAITIVVAFQFRQDQLWQAALMLGIPLAFLLELLRSPREIRGAALQTITDALSVVYVVFPLSFAILIRAMPDGLVWLLCMYTMSFGTDTAAYVGGRLYGKTPLAPTLSPKKTVEGAVVGAISGAVGTILILAFFAKFSVFTLIMAVIGPLVAIAGDLLESGIKRFFHTKDSHIAGFEAVPGHGGVLDRFDSIILVSTSCYFYLTLTGLAG